MKSDIFAQNGSFLMLALDHRESFRKILNPLNPQEVTDEEIIEVKKDIIASLHNDFSGFLIDPQYGLIAYKKLDILEKKPYLLSIEKSGYQEKNEERLTHLEYSVFQLKELGAKGVKLLVYFNPYVSSAINQLKIAGEVFKQCQEADLPFFLEIVTYYTETTCHKKENLVIESVKRFLSFGIRPDVFKLEYPKDNFSCQQITKILGRIPWILLSRGEDFNIFKIQLESAILNGASGFLAGRSLWQEVGGYKDRKERKKFLDEVVRKRFFEISQIVKKRSFLV